MKEKVLTAIAALSFSAFSQLNAQDFQTTVWQSYGISFKIPEDLTVEEDSEEGYSLSSSQYYILVQLLEGESMKPSELSQELKHIADEDQLTGQSKINRFELPHFYGVSLTGRSEEEECLYSYLTTKDGGGGFYISITYRQPGDSIPEKILKSFALEE